LTHTRCSSTGSHRCAQRLVWSPPHQSEPGASRIHIPQLTPVTQSAPRRMIIQGSPRITGYRKIADWKVRQVTVGLRHLSRPIISPRHLSSSSTYTPPTVLRGAQLTSVRPSAAPPNGTYTSTAYLGDPPPKMWSRVDPTSRCTQWDLPNGTYPMGPTQMGPTHLA